jgi:hypothetical protein
MVGVCRNAALTPADCNPRDPFPATFFCIGRRRGSGQLLWRQHGQETGKARPFYFCKDKLQTWRGVSRLFGRECPPVGVLQNALP